MQHNYVIEGFAVRLRPVANADASFIVELRSDPERVKYLNPISGRIEDQVAWLDQYYDRPGDYYFIIEKIECCRSVGLISIYNFENNKAEWGRWILSSGSCYAIESALLIYKAAFEVFNLQSVHCLTVAQNTSVINFHESCSPDYSCVVKDYFEIRGKKFDAVRHEFLQANWPLLQCRLRQLAQRIARRRATVS